MPTVTPVIPQSITVHLGAPGSAAQNVTTSFPDYIKNVASSEIYPTWPESALRANIYAQISFAMNRIFTEYYRNQGYDFDITNSTAFDQSFVLGRDVFENIGDIVDEIFNSYLVRPGFVEPFFAQYCDGVEVTCDGLSQWGSVDLARQGLTPYEILQYYYGDNINIRMNVPVAAVSESAPEVPLRVGSVGNDVKNMQIRLNRISQNYPAIPKILVPDGIFDTNTGEAVKAFQRIFGLTPDGIVGNATWYKIQLLYNSVKRLNELNSEGLTLSEISTQYPAAFRLGDSGPYVRLLQYFLSYISSYNSFVPPVAVDGVYGTNTENAVRAFQTFSGLDPDGIAGEQTWNAVYDSYRGIVQSQPASAYLNTPAPWPGRPLRQGDTGEEVRILQEYLNILAGVYTEISTQPVTGVFGTQTRANVIAYQNLVGIEPTGETDFVTWDGIAEEAVAIQNGSIRANGQYSG